MLSDTEIVNRLHEILKISDLDTATTGTVRRQLEEEFGVDLRDKKVFIREQVDLYLQTHFGGQEENDEGGDEKGEEEVKSEEEEEEGEEEEEEEVEGTSSGKNSSKKRSKKKDKEVKKRGGGGFTKLCSLSPELQEFVGVPELARTEVVKQLWKYIREHNLQDPSNRKNILCDKTLRTLFDVDSIDMFQMNKALTKHIWPLNTDGGQVKSSPKEKQRKPDRDEDSDESKNKAKRQKGGSSGILAPLTLSEALAKFLGSGDEALPRSEVVKRIWNYIKEHNLQDPSDKRIIICDEKLKELLGVDSFNGFTVSKLLTAHFVKT
ncbi:protein TRI1-like isoform X2 [Impatiens glandulifera]|uniref:protein TRI1-like isoform X2 n=1 Tax=Impatiens glandulifera TaxID=253017 RepID=UPI001FB090F8|nr:protein TRI1-like isoform X2 [Impatiens glandulifera]